jgi:hypothetical protein
MNECLRSTAYAGSTPVIGSVLGIANVCKDEKESRIVIGSLTAVMSAASVATSNMLNTQRMLFRNNVTRRRNMSTPFNQNASDAPVETWDDKDAEEVSKKLFNHLKEESEENVDEMNTKTEEEIIAYESSRKSAR